jgi:hypothetical protein
MFVEMAIVRRLRCFNNYAGIRLPIGGNTNRSTHPAMEAGIADSPLELCGKALA